MAPANPSAEQPPVRLGNVVVDAGGFDRNRTIVSFPLAVEGTSTLRLADGSGRKIPLQRHADGTATFILDVLAAGQKVELALEAAEAPAAAGPAAVKQGKVLYLSTNARPVVRFQMQGELPAGIDDVYLRGGYLHPLYTPAGVPLTGDYPVSHRHQHGIFSAWTRTRFGEHAIDFWNVDDKQGKVDFRSLGEVFRGPVFAGFTAELAHIAFFGSEPVVALNERWTVKTYQTHEGTPPYFVVDLDSKQETATSTPLQLEQYTYGGFALRGTEQWADPARVTFLTSEGLDRTNGDDKKGRWCAVGGEIDGSLVGFAMLGHPGNFRAPQTFRIHPKHPYMAFAPVKDGPFAIEPGKPYVSRFRIVSFDGPLDRELVERLWRDYANPPQVSIEVH